MPCFAHEVRQPIACFASRLWHLLHSSISHGWNIMSSAHRTYNDIFRKVPFDSSMWSSLWTSGYSGSHMRTKRMLPFLSNGSVLVAILSCTSMCCFHMDSQYARWLWTDRKPSCNSALIAWTFKAVITHWVFKRMRACCRRALIAWSMATVSKAETVQSTTLARRSRMRTIWASAIWDQICAHWRFIRSKSEILLQCIRSHGIIEMRLDGIAVRIAWFSRHRSGCNLNGAFVMPSIASRITLTVRDCISQFRYLSIAIRCFKIAF